MDVNKIKVLHVAPSLGMGGTEKVMQLFAMHTDSTRFDVAVYSPLDGPRGRLLRSAGILTHVTDDIGKVLVRYKPHIVHVHRAGWRDAALMRPLRLYKQQAAADGVPIGMVETNVFGRYDGSPGGLAFDTTLFVSDFCAKRYAAQNDIVMASPRYAVVYNPVDTDFFASYVMPPDIKDYSRPVIGRISRPDPGKWSHLALDFLPSVVREIPDLRYIVIGATDEARRYVLENGFTRNVEFADPVLTDAELAVFYDSLRLLAHANDTGESFGLVIAEAMACGLPVITHPAQGLRDNAQLELVENGVTGLVANTTEEYAQAVLWLLRHPEKAHRMGLAGREKVQRLYRAQTVTAQLESIYENLHAQSGGGV